MLEFNKDILEKIHHTLSPIDQLVLSKNMRWEGDKILSGSMSEDEFKNEYSRLKECKSRRFDSVSTTAEIKNGEIKVRITVKKFYAYLKGGKRRISKKVVHFLYTLKPTGRLYLSKKDGKRTGIRTIRSDSFTGRNSVQFVADIPAMRFNIVRDLVNIFFKVDWIKDLKVSYSLEDMVKSKCSIKYFMKHRYGKVFPKIFLYRYSECIDNYSTDDLETISKYLKDDRSLDYFSRGMFSIYFTERYGVTKQTADDYIRICDDLAIIPKIRFENKEHLNNEHVRLSLERDVRQFTLKVPDWVPEVIEGDNHKFDLITTGEELFKEGIAMSHCVNSYGSRVEKLESLIYRGTYMDQRVTMEICPNWNSKHKYLLGQVQKKANKPISAKANLSLIIDNLEIKDPRMNKQEDAILDGDDLPFLNGEIQAGPGILNYIRQQA